MSTGRLILGGLLILVGINALTGINILRYVFPILIIWFGWNILTGKRWGAMDTTNSSVDTLNEVLIFTGAKRILSGTTFAGGKITAIFAAADIDLSGVKTKEKVLKIEATAIFGGIKIRVPQSWSVTTDGVAIVGGYDNKTHTKEKTTHLHITGAAIFGGVEIVS